ncbi:hypothetical protein AARAC_003907 [Aspergillus arachidicola]|uniref:NmrA-like domain-containing protein n=1 Tax=Aspergillus arachidicola TaxID=656916 RepID=A0A2G7FUT4_9EURO|nr:hypothetical protein AARAC_003907 [Aspergillus arachidicola]
MFPNSKTTPLSPQRTFITGATGYIGRVGIEFAVAAGHTIRSLCRSTAGYTLLHSFGATPVRGTLSDSSIPTEEATSADMISHLAFCHDRNIPYTDILELEITAVDTLATARICINKTLVITGGTICVLPEPSGGETN